MPVYVAVAWIRRSFFTLRLMREEALRHYLASYLELFAVVEGSVELPLDRISHDRCTRVWSNQLARVDPERYLRNNVWLVCNFHIHRFLPALLEEAAAADYDFFYQANLQNWRISSASERAARRNLVAVESAAGVPPALLQLEQRLLCRPSGSVLLVEEYLGTNSLAGERWLRAMLERQFDRLFAGTRLPAPIIRFEVNSTTDGMAISNVDGETVASGIHGALLQEPEDFSLFASATEHTALDDLLGWEQQFRRWFEPSLAVDKERVRFQALSEETAQHREADEVMTIMGEVDLPICRAPSDYIFVSYRHLDFQRVVPVLRKITNCGFPIWYDHGIPGSSEWNAVIEERLKNCRLFMLFLSQAAVDSKYVRREVLLADCFNKPILSLQLEHSDLRHGMALLLSQFQMVDIAAADLEQHLRLAWK